MFTSAQWNNVIILKDCGRGQRCHNIKADTDAIKGNVACKDGIVMQLRPRRHTYEQEPNLFESQCSHCKVEKCHLSSHIYSALRLSNLIYGSFIASMQKLESHPQLISLPDPHEHRISH